MCELQPEKLTPEQLWAAVAGCQGRTFYTAKGLPFQYTVRGGEMFVNRRERAKSITRSTVFRAYEKLWDGRRSGTPVPGPKKLDVFGAPYIWSILTDLYPEFGKL